MGRYFWHRALRIFPGLWVCLIVTALVVAPLVSMRERGGLAGFWDHPAGPFDYIRANWWTGVRQYGISGLFETTTPWGVKTKSSVFDGALWSLAYEMLCYIGVAALAFTGVFSHARRFVLVLTLWAYVYIWNDYLQSSGWSGPLSGGSSTTFDLPLVGELSAHYIIYLSFLFLLGTAAELYRERVPINDVLGILSAVALGITLLFGGFFVVGLPAYAYLLLWLAVRLPQWFHRVGSKNDYSYGIYIYGFVAQQVLASYHVGRWGFAAYAGLSVVCAFACAFLSWHLVEKQALKLKHWQPAFPTGKHNIGRDHLGRGEAEPGPRPQGTPVMASTAAAMGRAERRETSEKELS
ncbi:hypothetical protein B4N89_13055 [Embleya scabrispora]|uniref:Acyltransferase 3 domain-containing protein n=1 Tax=Embleya scabrispora TaxID=159449 RepID=A0A1T3NY30_9ACTN|nr:hypothetical protein B4N89_13055 [Embleya scabrispora]